MEIARQTHSARLWHVSCVASADVKGSIFGVAGEVPYLWQRGSCFYGPALTFRSDFSSKVDNNGASSDGEKVMSVGLALEVGGTF